MSEAPSTSRFDGETMAQDKRKQSLYFPEDMLREIQDEAKRQDRSLSWIVQKTWKRSRTELMRIPSTDDLPGADDPDGAGD